MIDKGGVLSSDALYPRYQATAVLFVSKLSMRGRQGGGGGRVQRAPAPSMACLAAAGKDQ
jgi:hypothetical protein